MAFFDANTCEGTSGTTVTTANSAGPAQFSSTGLSGAGNTLTYDNAHAMRGATAVKCLIGGTAGASYVVWTFTAVTTAYSRKYFYFASLPSSNTRLIAFVDSGGTLLRGGIYLNTSGKIDVVNSASTIVGTSAAVIPTGQWVRVELDCTGNASTGVLTCRIYNDPDSLAATDTLNLTGQNTGGTIGQAWLGTSDSATTSSTHWQDDLAVSDQGPVGPSVPAAPSFAWVGAGAGSTSASSPVYPASGISSGDAIFAVTWSKASTGTGEPPALTAPAGWATVTQAWGGTGTAGVGTGPVKITVMRRNGNANGSENGVTLTSLISNPASSSFVYTALIGIRPVAGFDYAFAESDGSDTTAGTSFSVTAAADVGIVNGDLVLALAGFDIGTASGASAETITATGAVIGTVTEQFDSSTSSGNAVRGVISSAACVGGVSSAAAVMGITSAASVTGVGMILRVRELIAALQPQLVPPGLASPMALGRPIQAPPPPPAPVSSDVQAPAGVATSTVVAPAATTAVTATSGVAAVTAVAPAPTAAVSAAAGVATVSAVAAAPSTAVTANAAVATVAAAAPAPKAAITASAGVAAVQAVAAPPVPAVTASAGVATVQAAAPAAGHAATASAGVATSQAVAPPPTPAITASAGVGIVGAVAPQPVVNTSGSVNAPAQVAPVQAGAVSPTAAVQANAGVAAVLAAAAAPSLAVTANAQAAQVLTRALGATVPAAFAVARSAPTVADPRDGTATTAAGVTSAPTATAGVTSASTTTAGVTSTPTVTDPRDGTAGVT